MSLSFDSSKGDDKTTPVIQRTSPRTIPGTLSSSNKGAIDWLVLISTYFPVFTNLFTNNKNLPNAQK